MPSFRSPLLLLAAVLLAAAPSAATTHRTRPLRLKLPPADCSIAAIPSGPAQGTIAGKIFRLGGASVSQSGASGAFDNYLVTLEAPDGAGSTLVIVATASLPQGQALDGKVFMRKAVTDATEQPLAGPGQPQIPDWGIHYDPGQVDADSLSGTASIRLTFGARKAGALPGKIYFCEAGNTMAGDFTVDTGALP